jgi:hypothetical protein
MEDQMALEEGDTGTAASATAIANFWKGWWKLVTSEIGVATLLWGCSRRHVHQLMVGRLESLQHASELN